MAVLTASLLELHYGELEVFTDVTLEVADRARIGVMGPNGCGKTSLLRILVGELEPDRGTTTRPDGLRIGYVPQTPTRPTGGTLRDEVMVAFDELRHLEDALASSTLEIQQARDGQRRQAERRYSSLLERYEALGGYDYQNQMERVTSGVGLPPKALETPAASASGGEHTRAALAKALLADPDLLVLDEPTNHLDFDGLSWLEGFLARFSHAFVVVSHDRYFLDRVVNEVWDLDHGRLQRFRGNYSKYRDLKAEQTERQRRQFERQQEYVAREESFIQRYHAGQRSREARGRATRLTRLERIESPQRDDDSIQIGRVTASRTGEVAVATRGLKVGYAEGERLVELLSVSDLVLERGSRTALIGRNGVGKTTLLQTMLGLVPPLSGQATLGHNAEAGYFRQGSDDMPPDSTVLDVLLDARNLGLAEARNYLARFLFRGDGVFAPVSSLSGGERTRLALACLLVTGPNVLVLDEPTTHLDIPSREALEQVLLAYEGTLLFVSHDRHLLSLLARQLWVVEDRNVRHFAGTFDEWARDSLPAIAPSPRPKSSRRRARSRVAKPKERSQEPPSPSPEEAISALESRLAEIEGELEQASERRNVAEIALLGDEYAKTQARLEEAMKEWGE